MNIPITSSHRRRVAGFSLVELMVAITLGLLLLVGLATLFANTSVARGEIDKASRQIENGRFALQVLGDDIRHAGYYGPLNSPPGLPAALPDPCSTAIDATTIGIPLQGYYSSTATAPLTCLQGAAAGYKAGTAVLVVRRSNTASVPPGFVAGEFNIQASGCAGDPIPFAVSASASDFTLHSNAAPGCKPLPTALIAPVRPLYVRIYYVSNCTDADCSAAGADTVPTLKRVDVLPGGLSTPTAIVDGIESLQFDYGVDTTIDGAPESYTATDSPPSSLADWGNVMSVRVYVLARNVDATGSYTDGKSYALGSLTLTPVGSDLKYKRHAYSELVRLNNPAGLRE